jgi:type IV secretory pathway TrbF-like protein
MALTGNTTSVLLEYITSATVFSVANRQFVAVLIKNIVKKAYGQHDYTHYEEQKRREEESVQGDENDPNTFID